MIAQHRSRTVVFVAAGLILQAVGGTVARAGLLGAMLGWGIGLVGSICLLFGCGFFAKAKGYPVWVGLLGLLSCVGLVILVLIPDRHPGRG